MRDCVEIVLHLLGPGVIRATAEEDALRRAAYTYGRPVCDAGDATFRTCFAHVSRCFAVFRGVSKDSLMIRGFATRYSLDESGTYGSEFFGLIPATLHGLRTCRVAQGSVDSDLLACEGPGMRGVG